MKNLINKLTEWYKNITIRTKYFFLAIVVIGSIGIWLPVIVELLDKSKNFNLSNMVHNMITYFITILVSGSITYFFRKLKEAKIKGIASIFLDLVALIIFSLGLVIAGILLNVNDCNDLALIIGVLGILLSYRIWWIANPEDMNLPKEGPLGGDPHKDLRNG